MHNNPESYNQHSTNDEYKEWNNILPKDNFYQFQHNSQEASKNELDNKETKQKSTAEKHIEQAKNKPEVYKLVRPFAAKALAIAIGVTSFVGGLIATGPKDDFLKSEQAREKVIEMENVEKISFHGNIRSNPETTNSQDSNIITSINDEVSFAVPDGCTVYYYRDENDPNGGWYGISTDLLKNESLISKREARRDGDDYAWVSDGNTEVKTK